MTEAQRQAEVRTCLARVSDPELDEPVTELGFVSDIAIDAAGNVAIGFRLPTYWCAANFAFMMAEDMRREVAGLPWVGTVDVRLGEHMYADQINDGIARGLGFRETFGDAAAGDLQALRRVFLVKAFQRRQEALLRHLLNAGHGASDITSLRLADLRALPLDDAGRHLVRRYLDRRQVVAGDDDPAPAFVDVEGVALSADGLASYLRAIQRIGIGAEFNAALCRGLLAARFGDTQPAGEPTLLDFARMPPGPQQGPAPFA